MEGPVDGIASVPRLVNLDEDRLCIFAVGPTAAFREGRARQIDATGGTGRMLPSGRIVVAAADVRHICGHYVGVTVHERLSIA
jgi:hypothetical protein